MEITSTTTLAAYVEYTQDQSLIEQEWTITQDKTCKRAISLFTFRFRQFLEAIIEVIYIVVLKDHSFWHWPFVSMDSVGIVIDYMESLTNNIDDSDGYNNALYNVIQNYKDDVNIMDIIHVAINNVQDKHCPCIDKTATPRPPCTCVSKDKSCKWISEGVLKYVGPLIECLVGYVISKYCKSVGDRSKGGAYGYTLDPSNTMFIVTKTAIECVYNMTKWTQDRMHDDKYRDMETNTGITTTTTLKQQIEMSMNTYLTGQKMIIDKEDDCKHALYRFRFTFQQILHQIIDIVYPAAMNMCQCSHCITGTVSIGSVGKLIKYMNELTADITNKVGNSNGCQDDTLESLVLMAVNEADFANHMCDNTITVSMMYGIMPHLVFMIDCLVALVMSNHCKPINQHAHNKSQFGLYITGNVMTVLSVMAKDVYKCNIVGPLQY